MEKKYYVDFGPELLQLLGPNLYTNIYYVLGEIIANAYDADAENVYIIYDTNLNSIIIEDDGNGMSYQDVNNKFLPIGITSRSTSEDTFSKKFKRRRMGRKGIGKLAALSVSQKVKIITKQNGEKSGCILSLNISHKNNDGKYEIPSIPEDQIVFHKINNIDHGSAIIMENSRYSMHKSIESAKRNLSIIFPFACKNFKIHLINTVTSKEITIEDSTTELIELSDTLITFCDPDSKYDEYLDHLHDYFNKDRYYANIRNTLTENLLPIQKVLNYKKSALHKRISMINNSGNEKDYDLIIEGWIATYQSTRDKKKNTDFPVNFISLISNEKVGQLDILPDISTDRMQEAYVVGQFFIDLLEETELPDIAASNRQGYKEDDERVTTAKEQIKSYALKPILDLKSKATIEKNYLKQLNKDEQLRKSKLEFDTAIKKVIDDPEFKKVITNSDNIKTTLEQSWELKDTLKEAYRKVMISHNGDDKKLVDELEKILHFCGFRKDEIIYTSSSYYESGITGAYTNIYDFLKDFFVNTTKRNDLSIIYVLNDSFIHKWDPILEAGAGWVLDSKRYPIYTDTFNSIKSPFEVQAYTPCLKIGLSNKDVHYLANTIYQICQNSGKLDKTESDIIKYIETCTKLVEYK